MEFCKAHYMYPFELTCPGDDKVPTSSSTSSSSSKKTDNNNNNNILNTSSLHQIEFVKYENLKTDLVSSVVELFKKLYLPSPNRLFRRHLIAEHMKTLKYKTDHHHSLEDCCNMNEMEFKEVMKEVYLKLNKYY